MRRPARQIGARCWGNATLQLIAGEQSVLLNAVVDAFSGEDVPWASFHGLGHVAHFEQRHH